MKLRFGLFLAASVTIGVIAAACSPNNADDNNGNGTSPTPTQTGTSTATPIGTPIGNAIHEVASWPGFAGNTTWTVFDNGFTGLLKGFSFGTPLSACSSNGIGSTFNFPVQTLAAASSSDTIAIQAGANYAITTFGVTAIHVAGLSACNTPTTLDWSLEYFDDAVDSCDGTVCSNEIFNTSMSMSPANSFYNTTPTVVSAVSAFHSTVTASLDLSVTNPPTGEPIDLVAAFFYSTTGADLFGCTFGATALFPSATPSLITPCPVGVDDLFNAGDGSYQVYLIGTYPNGHLFLQSVPFAYSTTEP